MSIERKTELKNLHTLGKDGGKIGETIQKLIATLNSDRPTKVKVIWGRGDDRNINCTGQWNPKVEMAVCFFCSTSIITIGFKR